MYAVFQCTANEFDVNVIRTGNYYRFFRDDFFIIIDPFEINLFLGKPDCCILVEQDMSERASSKKKASDFKRNYFKKLEDDDEAKLRLQSKAKDAKRSRNKTSSDESAFTAENKIDGYSVRKKGKDLSKSISEKDSIDKKPI